MPQWAGSCWYYLRFLDPLNSQQMLTPEAEKYWMPVDLYVGGAEHAVLHLLYARFWHKVNCSTNCMMPHCQTSRDRCDFACVPASCGMAQMTHRQKRSCRASSTVCQAAPVQLAPQVGAAPLRGRCRARCAAPAQRPASLRQARHHTASWQGRSLPSGAAASGACCLRASEKLLREL